MDLANRGLIHAVQRYIEALQPRYAIFGASSSFFGNHIVSGHRERRGNDVGGQREDHRLSAFYEPTPRLGVFRHDARPECARLRIAIRAQAGYSCCNTLDCAASIPILA